MTLTLLVTVSTVVIAKSDKPNILLIMSDDVGITNISAYGDGLVGYKTPNIDPVTKACDLTRVRERGMRRFKSTRQAQRFLSVHATVYNLFNLGRHLVSASHYRDLRQGALASWISVTAK